MPAGSLCCGTQAWRLNVIRSCLARRCPSSGLGRGKWRRCPQRQRVFPAIGGCSGIRCELVAVVASAEMRLVGQGEGRVFLDGWSGAGRWGDAAPDGDSADRQHGASAEGKIYVAGVWKNVTPSQYQPPPPDRPRYDRPALPALPATRWLPRYPKFGAAQPHQTSGSCHKLNGPSSDKISEISNRKFWSY